VAGDHVGPVCGRAQPALGLLSNLVLICSRADA